MKNIKFGDIIKYTRPESTQTIQLVLAVPNNKSRYVFLCLGDATNPHYGEVWEWPPENQRDSYHTNLGVISTVNKSYKVIGSIL